MGRFGKTPGFGHLRIVSIQKANPGQSQKKNHLFLSADYNLTKSHQIRPNQTCEKNPPRMDTNKPKENGLPAKRRKMETEIKKWRRIKQEF